MHSSLFHRERTCIDLYSEDEAVAFLTLQQLISRNKQKFICFPVIPDIGLEQAVRHAVRMIVAEGYGFPWKRLDQGANAKVFELSCGKVLRLSFHSQDGTFYFHQRCAVMWEEGLASPWMPKVYASFCIEGFVYASILEKVITLPDNENPSNWKNLPDFLQGDQYWELLSTAMEDKAVENLKEVLASNKNASYKVLYLASMCLTMADVSFFESQIQQSLTHEVKDSLTEFIEIFSALFEFFENQDNPQIFDCWHHNMGIRPNTHELVLLDPLCPQ